MKEQLEAIFNALQKLEIKPTPGNVSIMSGVYHTLRELYGEIGEVKDDAENGQAADPE